MIVIWDVVYKEMKFLQGEIYCFFEVMFLVFVNIVEKVYVFVGDELQEVVVWVWVGKDEVKGQLLLFLLEGWWAEFVKVEFEIVVKFGEQVVIFMFYFFVE